MQQPRVTLMVVAAVTAVLSGAHATPVAAQTVKTLPQGEKEVHFHGGCIVFYDNRDKRTHAQPGCSSDEIRRADRLIADGGNPNEPPEIIMGGNGEAEVVFGNTCVVYYDRDGGRKNANPKCDRDQRRRADDAMTAYRREQGLDGSSTSHSGGHRDEPPRIVAGKSGSAAIIFDNGCIVNYDDDGQRKLANSRCDRDQKQQADDAMAAYRREQGLDGGSASHSGRHRDEPPRIVGGKSGSAAVIFDNGCIINYDENGQRTVVNKNCDRDQRRQADDAIAARRRD